MKKNQAAFNFIFHNYFFLIFFQIFFFTNVSIITFFIISVHSDLKVEYTVIKVSAPPSKKYTERKASAVWPAVWSLPCSGTLRFPDFTSCFTLKPNKGFPKVLNYIRLYPFDYICLQITVNARLFQLWKITWVNFNCEKTVGLISHEIPVGLIWNAKNPWGWFRMKSDWIFDTIHFQNYSILLTLRPSTSRVASQRVS